MFDKEKKIPEFNKKYNSLQWFNNKQQQIEIQFITKFYFSNLSQVNPPHKQMNKRSPKKNIKQHVHRCQELP